MLSGSLRFYVCASFLRFYIHIGFLWFYTHSGSLDQHKFSKLLILVVHFCSIGVFLMFGQIGIIEENYREVMK